MLTIIEIILAVALQGLFVHLVLSQLHDRFDQLEARTNAIHLSLLGQTGSYNIRLEGDGSVKAPHNVVIRKNEPIKTAPDAE